MKTKEEYVAWVKEWKITHEALVKLQLYVKKYLIKTKYPHNLYILSDDKIKECLKRYKEVYKPNDWSYFHPEKSNEWDKERCSHWKAAGFKWQLREKLRGMYEVRSFEKEQFKQSQLETAEV
jgi:hypothetical protein